MSAPRKVAVVGSELQLLSLFEAQDLGVLAATYPDHSALDVLIAGSYRPASDLAAEAAARNLRLVPLRRWHLPRLLRCRHLALGDAYSQLTLLLLAARRPQRVVILEDGLATVAALLHHPASGPFTRPRCTRPPLLVRVLARRVARTMQRLATSGSLHWVVNRATAEILDSLDTEPVGKVHRHRFDALHSISAPALTLDRSVRRLVVGSSYATNGLLDAGFYRAWLQDACLVDPTHTLFAPHPRDLHDARRVAANAGAAISDAMASVERIALMLPDLVSIDCLPSSPALSLDALGFRDRLQVARIEAPRWSPGAASAFIALTMLLSPGTAAAAQSAPVSRSTRLSDEAVS